MTQMKVFSEAHTCIHLSQQKLRCSVSEVCSRLIIKSFIDYYTTTKHSFRTLVGVPCNALCGHMS